MITKGRKEANIHKRMLFFFFSLTDFFLSFQASVLAGIGAEVTRRQAAFDLFMLRYMELWFSWYGWMLH